MISVSYVDYKGKMFLRGVSCLHLFPPILYIYSGTPLYKHFLITDSCVCLNEMLIHFLLN